MNNYIKVHQPLNVDLRTQKTQTKLYTVLERFWRGFMWKIEHLNQYL